MSVHHFPEVTLTIDGQIVPTNGASVSTDSPLDLHLPPNVGNFPGSDARADLARTAPVGWRPETPWSPSFRARPGSPATLAIDGTRVFTGFVDDAGVSLAAGSVNASLVDPLHYVDRTFTAPATLKRLAPLPGSSQERPVGCSSLFYVDRCLAALGVHSTARVAGRSVLHVPMAGCAQPVVGTVTRPTRRAPDGTATWPFVEPLFRPMPGGRLGVQDPHLEYETDPDRSEATVGSWHLTVEIDPSSPSGHGYVRTVAMGSEVGFGFRIDADRENLQVQTWDEDNVAHSTLR